MRTSACASRSSTKGQCGVQDPFELEREKQLASQRFIKIRATVALAKKTVENFLANFTIFDKDEIPRLHDSDGTGMMSGRQYSDKNIVGYGACLKLPPYVAS